MEKRLSLIQLRQLEERLDKFRQLAASEAPKDGWINAMRQALGITTEQLARRMGVTRQAVLQIEAGERQQRVTWASLRKAAEAMDCDVVFALVPRGSINQVLLRQGRRQAEKHIARISHSMKLDAHIVGPDEEARQVEELAAQLSAERSRGLWEPEPTASPATAPPPPYPRRARQVR